MAEEYNESLTRGGQPGDRELERSQRDREIIEDAIKGMRIWEIAEKHKLSERHVSRILRDVAEQVRQQSAEVVAQAFELQRARLERLYRLVEMELQTYEAAVEAWHALPAEDRRRMPAPAFDDKPFRVAVMIFDRQSRLMGLDRGVVGPNAKSPTGWLDQAPIEQVAAYAKQLKMNLPSEFQT